MSVLENIPELSDHRASAILKSLGLEDEMRSIELATATTKSWVDLLTSKIKAVLSTIKLASETTAQIEGSENAYHGKGYGLQHI